ncbi:hypothetical protein ACOME3_008629 [Neoechinorhynchus agilis]
MTPRRSSAPSSATTNPPLQPEIPVWFENRKKWVTGITKHTSVNDVIFALLRHSLSHQSDSKYEGQQSSHYPSLKDYQLVCTSNGQRSTLKGRTKMYKLWKSWLNSKVQVTLLIKRIDTNEGGDFKGNQQGLLSRILGLKCNKDYVEGDDHRTPLEENNTRTNTSTSHEYISTVIEQDRILCNQNDKIRLLNRGIAEAEAALTKAGFTENRYTAAAASGIDEFKLVVRNIFNPVDNAELDMLLAHIKRFFSLNDQCSQQYHGSHVVPSEMCQDPLSAADVSLRDQVCASRELTRRQCKQIHDLELEVRDCDNALARKKAELRQLEQGLMAGALNQLLDAFESDSGGDEKHKKESLDTKETKNNETDSGVNSMSSTDDYHQTTSKTHIETLV